MIAYSSFVAFFSTLRTSLSRSSTLGGNRGMRGVGVGVAALEDSFADSFSVQSFCIAEFCDCSLERSIAGFMDEVLGNEVLAIVFVMRDG